MGYKIAAIALGPVLLLQGRHVRRTVPRLPEPAGPRSGCVGAGRSLRVLIAGDSAAAGVGTANQDQALSGQLIRRLDKDFRVEWQLEARTGATTENTITRLAALPESRFDVMVTSLGVNDVTAGLGINSWLQQQQELRELARQTLGVRHFVLAGLPPVDVFPALPQPLRWYLGSRARIFSRRLKQDIEQESDVEFLDLRFTLDPDLMATDGFHPGPGIYNQWGELAAAMIKTRWGD